MKKNISIKNILIFFVLIENILTNYILNPNFLPANGYQGAQWYSSSRITSWSVSNEPTFYGFYVSQWPMQKNDYSITTRLVMFMNRAVKYFQKLTNITPGFYRITADVALKMSQEYNHLQQMQFYIAFCQIYFTVVLKKEVTSKTNIFVGETEIKTSSNCQLQIYERNFVKSHCQIYISNVRVIQTVDTKKQMEEQQLSLRFRKQKRTERSSSIRLGKLGSFWSKDKLKRLQARMSKSF